MPDQTVPVLQDQEERRSNTSTADVLAFAMLSLPMWEHDQFKVCTKGHSQVFTCKLARDRVSAAMPLSISTQTVCHGCTHLVLLHPTPSGLASQLLAESVHAHHPPPPPPHLLHSVST